MLGESRRGRSSDLVHAFFVDTLIPAGHILRRLDRVLDTQWVREAVKALYTEKTGRPSWDPEVILRMMLLGFLYGYSEKRLCEELRMHLGFRWFCLLQPSENVPDRTTLVKLRNQRWQQDLWVKLLDKTIQACIEAGLVSGRHVALDGTIIQANAAQASVEPIEPPLSLQDHLLQRCGWEKFVPEKPEDGSREHPSDDDPMPGGSTDFRGESRSNATHRSVTDPDALLYRKSSCTGAQLAYLGHFCVDTKSRVILAAMATPAHTAAEWAAGAALLDEANARVDGAIEVVSADAGYGVERFLAEVEARHLEPHIPVQGKVEMRPEPSLAPRGRSLVQLDAARRARIKRLAVRGRNRAVKARGTRGYAISRKLRLRIEHTFGEGKTCHGLGRARYRGVAKVNCQVLITAAVINLKRLLSRGGRRHAAQSTALVRASITRFCALCTPARLFARFSALLTASLLSTTTAPTHA
jgi:transposase